MLVFHGILLRNIGIEDLPKRGVYHNARLLLNGGGRWRLCHCCGCGCSSRAVLEVLLGTRTKYSDSMRTYWFAEDDRKVEAREVDVKE